MPSSLLAQYGTYSSKYKQPKADSLKILLKFFCSCRYWLAKTLKTYAEDKKMRSEVEV